MEEFIPFILIVIGWHPDHSGKFEIAKRSVFESEADCRLHGTEAVEGRKIYELEHGGAKFEYFCVPSASGDEAEQAWQRRLEQIQAEREKQKTEESK
jgi:hypothetical protein